MATIQEARLTMDLHELQERKEIEFEFKLQVLDDLNECS